MSKTALAPSTPLEEALFLLVRESAAIRLRRTAAGNEAFIMEQAYRLLTVSVGVDRFDILEAAAKAAAMDDHLKPQSSGGSEKS